MSDLSYHELTRSERDFLTAVGSTPADATGRDVADYIQGLRCGERPGDNTTYAVLERLVSYDLVHRADSESRGNRYQLTEEGYYVLRAASQELLP